MSSQQNSNLISSSGSKQHTIASDMLHHFRPSRSIQSAEQIFSPHLINSDTPAPLISLDNPPIQSPATPSPAGSQQLRFILQRLAEIDAESRELLKKLFSLLDKDERLERYIKKRLDNPKVSRMWELVEQILASRQGTGCTVNFDELETHFRSVDKGIKVRQEFDYEISTRLDRFKIRTLDTGDDGGTEIESTTSGSKC